jgi:cobyrinic acid a,c-diamide synthase
MLRDIPYLCETFSITVIKGVMGLYDSVDGIAELGVLPFLKLLTTLTLVQVIRP